MKKGEIGKLFPKAIFQFKSSSYINPISTMKKKGNNKNINDNHNFSNNNNNNNNSHMHAKNGQEGEEEGEEPMFYFLRLVLAEMDIPVQYEHRLNNMSSNSSSNSPMARSPKDLPMDTSMNYSKQVLNKDKIYY